jgi:2,5-diamino-6-(ribosylamino)-4(3H)-pyrimidinone 5'-phosphate reductase
MPRSCEESENNKVTHLLNRLREKEEKLLQLLSWLAEESAKGIIIIVEGEKDVRTLRAFGVEGKLVSAKTGGKSLLDVVSEVEKHGVQEVILLFDFDRRGREWTKRVRQHLEKVGVTPNVTIWRELAGLVRKDVKDIEGLASYMKTLKSKICNS